RNWHFPPQSSGGFGDQTLGRWLTYDEMKRSSKEFLRRREAGEESIFWNTNKSYVIWTDYHAQYVEHPNDDALQPGPPKEICHRPVHVRRPHLVHEAFLRMRDPSEPAVLFDCQGSVK